MQLEGSHQIILTLCEKLCQCRFHVFVYGFFELVLQDVTQTAARTFPVILSKPWIFRRLEFEQACMIGDGVPFDKG